MKSLLIALCLLSTAAMAQSNDTTLADQVKYMKIDLNAVKAREYAAGRELRKYSNAYYAGFGLQIGGGIALAVGLTNPVKDNRGQESTSPLVYVGGGLAAIGWFVQLFSHGHVAAAGRYLSNGITVPIVSHEARGWHGATEYR